MPGTPNMNLVLPTDHDSKDVWGVILATSFGLVDAHDHTTGKGVKVPAGALNINADVSWSSGGLQYALTDLRAIDFSPQPASGMTALAGALFLNSTDSELYYRTTAGTNVKFTNGAALNVAAFTGGIGGDYAAAGALVVFDDATDSYWFQQQVGAAVRQYARMRSADVDLYEFKANPAAGVPTNRVRLASPAALAASYAITFPGALPASTRPVLLSSAGLISAPAPVSITRGFGCALAQPTATGGPAATFGTTGSRPLISLGVSGGATYLPLLVNPGETITAWTVYLQKTSAAGTISAFAFDHGIAADSATAMGTQTNGANNPGPITLGATGLSVVVVDSHDYVAEIFGGGTTGDAILGYTVTVTPP